MTEDLAAAFEALDRRLPDLRPPLTELHRRGRSARLRRRALVAAALALVATGVPSAILATRTGPQQSVVASKLPPEVQKKLLELADQAAARNNGRAEHVDVVATTRLRAALLTSGTVMEAKDDAPVYLVQVEGAFTCTLCHSPPDARVLIEGSYLTLAVGQEDFTTPDFGLMRTRADLSQLGPVTRLR